MVATHTIKTRKFAQTTGWSGLAQAALVQRKCVCGGIPGPTVECDESRNKKLQSKITQPSTLNTQLSDVPPIVHEVLTSSGQPLDANTRAFMESRFGHDFGNVRVHADARAADSAHAVHANAYTLGHNIVFGANKYAPTSHAGRQLLAHELAHTIQQRASETTTGPIVPDTLLESTAEQAGRAAASGCKVEKRLGASGLTVARALASPDAYSDDELVREIAKFAEKVKMPIYPGRDSDLEWLKEMRAVYVQRASVKPRLGPPKPTPAQERSAAVHEAESAAAAIEVELLRSDEEEAEPVSMSLGAKHPAKAAEKRKPRKQKLDPKFSPGGFTNWDIYGQTEVRSAWIEAAAEASRAFYIPKDRRPFEKRLAAARKAVPMEVLPSEFAYNVFNYGVAQGLFAPAEREDVDEAITHSRSRAEQELKHDKMMAAYHQQLQAEAFHNQLDLMFIQAALMGGPKAPLPIQLGYAAYSGAETGLALGHAIQSGDPTDIVGALLPVAGGMAFHGVIGGEPGSARPEEPSGLPLPEEATPDQVRALYKDEPDAVKKNLSGSFHQLVWEQLGGDGPAPLAFRAGRVIQVNELRWSSEVGDIGDINPPEAVVPPYSPPQPGATAPTLPDPRASTIPGGPLADPNALVAPGAATGQGTVPPVPRPAPAAPRSAAPARAGTAAAPAMQAATPVLEADAVAAYRANRNNVFRSPSHEWHEQMYRMDRGKGQVPPAFRSGGAIIVDPDFQLP
jgi:hypothetical protein